MRNSLRTRLTIAFIGLAIVPLLFVGVLVGWQSFRSQQEQALNLQRQVAQRVSSEVNAFIQERGNELRLLTEIRGLQRLDQAQQSSQLSGLLSAQDVYEELALLDNQGQEKLRLSRLAIISASELGNRAGAAEFERPKATGETYFSSVWFDGKSGEPFMTIAIPLVDLRSGEFTGALVADFRFKTVQDLMVMAEAGESGTVYVVSKPDNRVIVHRNPTVVLQEVQFDPPEEDGFYPGLDGTDVAMAIEHIKLGEQEFAIVAEKPVAEALELAINTVYITVIVMAIFLVIAGVLGFLAVRQIVRPVEIMATAAQIISAGDLSQRVEVTSRDELGILATAFNAMTEELREIINTLEERVTGRTRQLETMVEVSRQLTGILDLRDLLRQVVTLTKETFDYYHVHIYLLEEKGQTLIMTEGYGEAGVQMKRQGHNIPLNVSQSLVARAAREKRIITVQNTREDPTWLPNPLLPNTHSEMAVPVVVEQAVMGVLDVQSESVGGLTQEDETLLQALANQVAVAVRNARAFRQTQHALDEAQRLQRLYTGQAWEKFSAFRPTTNYEVRQPALPPLQQIATPEALTALQHKRTIDLRISGSGKNGAEVSPAEEVDQKETSRQKLDSPAVDKSTESTEPKAETPETETGNKFESALATPLRLGDEIIGVLGIRDDNPDRRWTEEEIALIEAVSEQMSLALENARLFEETGRRARRERIIADVTRRIWASGELEQVMNTAVEQLGTTLDASKVVIRLGTEEQLMGLPTEPNDEAKFSQKQNDGSLQSG
jgi:GAF domain-containing protein/HAMP domain-containing protein